jgi:L-aspartate oxidase
MGSNSLLEGLVLGLRGGAAAALESGGSDRAQNAVRRSREMPKPPPGVRVSLEDLIYSLKSLMWRQMGVERERGGLEDALAKIAFWSRAVEDLGPSEPRAWELLNMLTVARLMTLGALAREESRGCHWRSDHPEQQAGWRRHTLLRARAQGETLEAIELELSAVRDQAMVP